MKGQCEQYCELDKLELEPDKNLIARMETVISDKVLVIDTYAVCRKRGKVNENTGPYKELHKG